MIFWYPKFKLIKFANHLTKQWFGVWDDQPVPFFQASVVFSKLYRPPPYSSFIRSFWNVDGMCLILDRFLSELQSNFGINQFKDHLSRVTFFGHRDKDGKLVWIRLESYVIAGLTTIRVQSAKFYVRIHKDPSLHWIWTQTWILDTYELSQSSFRVWLYFHVC